jgi:hypothetical protein
MAKIDETTKLLVIGGGPGWAPASRWWKRPDACCPPMTTSW